MLKKIAVVALSAQLMVAAVATEAQARPRYRSPMDRAIAQCVGAIGIGAVLGAVIGNNTGSGNARRGAVTGAVVGAGACAIILAMRAQHDRERMAQLEAQAMEADESKTTEYVGDDGRRRQIKVDITPVAPPPQEQARSAPPRECRMRQTTLGVDGNQTALPPEQICRDPVTRAWSVVPS